LLRMHFDRKEAKESADAVARELLERNKELWTLQQEMARVGQVAALSWMAGARSCQFKRTGHGDVAPSQACFRRKNCTCRHRIGGVITFPLRQ
jgi:hypothetical protein